MKKSEIEKTSMMSPQQMRQFRQMRHNSDNWKHPRTIVVIQIPLSLSLWGEFVILNSFQINIYTILDKTRSTRLLIPWSRPQVVQNNLKLQCHRSWLGPRKLHMKSHLISTIYTSLWLGDKLAKNGSCSRNVTISKEEQLWKRVKKHKHPRHLKKQEITSPSANWLNQPTGPPLPLIPLQ